MFSIIRPNTGPSFIEMDAAELLQKYAPCPRDDVQAAWEETYESSLDHCMHGPVCQAGPGCHIGRRLSTVTILSGSVVRTWDALERTLQRHEAELSKADRSLRIVRVEGAGVTPDLPLIGVRFPGHLLPEVVAELSALALSQLGAAVGHGVAVTRTEAPLPVDQRALKKAFR